MNCRAKRLECGELAPAFELPDALRQRQQAGRTPNASRSPVAAWLLCVSLRVSAPLRLFFAASPALIREIRGYLDARRGG